MAETACRAKLYLTETQQDKGHNLIQVKNIGTDLDIECTQVEKKGFINIWKKIFRKCAHSNHIGCRTWNKYNLYTRRCDRESGHAAYCR